MNETFLQGKVAVITGASRGIGLAIANALAREGCSLALAARRMRPLQAGAGLFADPGRNLLATCDVSDPRSVQRFFKAVRKKFQRVDFLVNNAGIAHELVPASELQARKWQDVIATNLTGTFLCAQAALPLMRRGGVIVNNLSIASQMVFPGMAAYNASKQGALALTNTLREELRARGIRVLALIAGATATDIWNQFMPRADRKTMLSPETVAAAVVDALKMPADASVEEIRLMPLSGTSR